MRSIEEKIDIPDSRKDDFRREIMNYIGALVIDGKTFDYKTNERLYKALELKLFEDQKGLDQADQPGLERRRQGNAGQDRHRQEPPDQELRVLRRMRDRRVELRGQHLRARRRKGVTGARSAFRALTDIGSHIWFSTSNRIICRFRQIVRGKIKQNLQEVHLHGEMIGTKGNDLVSIPVPQIEVPHFRYGKNGRAASVRARAKRHAICRRRAGEGQAGNAARRAYPRSRSLARRAGRRSWAKSSNCRASSPRERDRRQRPNATSTLRSRRTGPNRCGTSSAPTSKPCGGRSLRAPTTRQSRASCRFAKTSAFGPGRPNRGRRATRSSST